MPGTAHSVGTHAVTMPGTAHSVGTHAVSITDPCRFQEFGVNVLVRDSLARVIAAHATEIRCIWNLAAPLSVDTAKDPQLAYKVFTAAAALMALHATSLHRALDTPQIGSTALLNTHQHFCSLQPATCSHRRLPSVTLAQEYVLFLPT